MGGNRILNVNSADLDAAGAYLLQGGGRGKVRAKAQLEAVAVPAPGVAVLAASFGPKSWRGMGYGRRDRARRHSDRHSGLDTA